MNKVDDLFTLWLKVQVGNESAYSNLHKKLYPGLFNYANKMLKDDQLTDDILQDLFVKFWENRERISIVNVKAYFYKSTRSMVLNHFRMMKVRMSKTELIREDSELEFSKEELMIADESDLHLKHLMISALNKLPTKQKEVIYMRFYENLSYNQISEITGIRYQSVINHVYRAVQSLRELSSLVDIYAA